MFSLVKSCNSPYVIFLIFVLCFCLLAQESINDSNPLIFPLAQCPGSDALGPTGCLGKVALFSARKLWGLYWKWWKYSSWALSMQKNQKTKKKPLSICALRTGLIFLGSCHQETVTSLPVDFLLFPLLRVLLGGSAWLCVCKPIYNRRGKANPNWISVTFAFWNI